MTEQGLTQRAYQYAQSVKKVNEGVIESFKKGFREGENSVIYLPAKNLIEILLTKYRSKQAIERDLGMADARRGLNDTEIKEARNHDQIVQLIKDLEELI